MTVDRRSRVGTRRTGDDQPRPLQRGGTARRPGRRHHPDRAALRPQQLRAAHARRHPGDRRRRRRTPHPHPRGPAGAAGPRAGGHAGVCRQRAPGHEAAADRRAVGRLRGLDGTVDRRPAAATCSRWRSRQPRASTSGSKAPTTAPTTFRRSSRRPTRTTSPSSARCRSPRQPTRPSAILIAYEMNGEPLAPDHGAPFRLIVPALVRRRLGEVAEADRRPHRALRRRVPDRPLHLPVARPPARARHAHAGAGPHHRPRARRRSSPSAPTRSAGRPGPAPGPITSVDVSLTGEGDWHPAQLDPPTGPYQWQDWSLRLGRRRRRPAHPARPSDRRRRQRPARRPAVEPAGLREQRHRGHLRRPPVTHPRLAGGRHNGAATVGPDQPCRSGPARVGVMRRITRRSRSMPAR